MSNFIDTPKNPAETKSQGKYSKNLPNLDLAGKVTNTLGSGDNAKNSIIYLTIKYAFITGSIISTLVVINYWFFRQNEKVPDFTGDIKIIWEIIIPIITLALGYAFGKSHK